MKLGLTLIVAAVGLALASPAFGGGDLTIKALGFDNKPVGEGTAMLKDGPIWGTPMRPSATNTVVLAGHDVTPVPGYGSHGPFYNLVTLKKGYLVQIRWKGKLFIYRVVGKARYYPESDDSVVTTGDVGAVWMYSCWPRYTHNGRLWVEAVLVSIRNLVRRS